MKKTTALIMMIFSLGISAEVFAQSSATFNNMSLFSQLGNEGSIERAPSWWNLLGRQLTFSLDQGFEQGYENVSSEAIQNLLFIAYNYQDQVALRDAVPVLLDIFRDHEDSQFRIMAVAALDAIGDRNGLKSLERLVKDEPSERVQRIAMAAIKN